MTASIRQQRQRLRSAFLEAMSVTAATVTVVTTDGPAGRAGVTVSAMSSVSADSALPSLLVCLHGAGRAAPAVLANRAFCVNVLREDQADLSDRFAGRIEAPDGDRFSGADWTAGATGAPRALGALAAFDCRLIEARLIGTHHVIFGAVEDVHVAADGGPLIYSRRGYRRAASLA